MSNWNWPRRRWGDIDGNGTSRCRQHHRRAPLLLEPRRTEFRDGDANPPPIGVFQVRAGETYSFSSPALADLDGDGGAEIIFARATRDTSTVTTCTRCATTGRSRRLASLADDQRRGRLQRGPWGDLDQDGAPEVVFVSENDRLHVLRTDGSELAPFPITFVSNCSPYASAALRPPWRTSITTASWRSSPSR